MSFWFGMPPGFDQSHNWVGPEKLTTALICDLAVSFHPLTVLAGSSAHQRARVPPAEPPTR